MFTLQRINTTVTQVHCHRKPSLEKVNDCQNHLSRKNITPPTDTKLRGTSSHWLHGKLTLSTDTWLGAKMKGATTLLKSVKMNTAVKDFLTGCI